MKNLIIVATLVSSLFFGQAVMAQEGSANGSATNIETLVVISKPEVANFEIYSLELAEIALESVVEVMVESLSNSVSEVGSKLVSSPITLGSSI